MDNALIEKVVSSLVKQTMVIDKIENTDSVSWVNVYLSVKPRFEVTFGVSSVAKDGNEISGDTHSVIRTDNGKCIVALCDGMGSGDKAEQMSATSINLVESFYAVMSRFSALYHRTRFHNRYCRVGVLRMNANSFP